MDEVDDKTIGFLVRTEVGKGAAPDPECPDANLLSGYGSDALLPEEAGYVKAHLSMCPPCTRIVDSIRRDSEVEVRGNSVRRLSAEAGLFRHPAILITAALIVLTASLAILRLYASESRSIDQRMDQISARLRSEHPEILGDYHYLGPLERSNPDAPVHRSPGPLLLISPRQSILDLQPTFRWRSTSETSHNTEYHVELKSEDLSDLIWEGSTRQNTITYPENAPALKRGKVYRWFVFPKGSKPSESFQFRAATLDLKQRYEQASEILRDEVPVELLDLSLAHLAIRMKLWVTAEESAKMACFSIPDESAALETLYYVQSLLGTEEASS